MFTLIDYGTRSVCLEALAIILRNFRALETAVPPARWVPWENGYNWRFVEQLPAQLLVSKLARQITGVQTADLLLLSGHLQEVGVTYRMLDEIAEDIIFICLGLNSGNWTQHHEDYARYFWSEDNSDKQPPIRRKSVRSYVNRAFDQADPSTADAVGREIYKTYSDYAHARSAPIMGMIHGPPPRFDLVGIHNAQARFPYMEQNPTYFYRCLVSVCMVARVVLPDDSNSIFVEFKEFETKHQKLLF